MGFLATQLTVLFVGLKLGKIITWSWWLVLAPIPAAILVWILIVIVALWFELK